MNCREFDSGNIAAEETKGTKKYLLRHRLRTTSNTVRPETVPYPFFMLFVIYNKREKAWHKGGAKEFVPSKYVTGAKMYQSCTYAEKVAAAICEEGQDISDFVVLRYEARATEAIVCGEENGY